MVAEAKMVASMKNSARLYLPWPVVSAFVASCGSRPAEAQPGRRADPSSFHRAARRRVLTKERALLASSR